ncbi:MAG TPA: hypothetical protein VFY07_00680 [Geomobilimonas sp.]|nr:hypothetical protein [Geomobilimonas sp.]
MTRKLLIPCIVAASFFLVFLGMRNPFLNDNDGPKHRTGAVIESTEKPSEELVKNAFHPCMATSHSIPLPVEREFISLLNADRPFTTKTPSRLTARAPPGPLHRIS